MVGEMQNDLHVRKPIELITIHDNDETPVFAPNTPPQCLVCYEHISSALPSATMPCCNSAAIHVFCLETWAAFNSTCIFCRAPVDYSATGDNFEVLMSPLKGRDANLLVEMKESMAKKVLSDAMARLSDKEDEVEEESPVEKKRRASIEKSQKRQILQAGKMMERRAEDKSTASVGDIVALKMDFRDVSHARGVLGIVFAKSGSRAGGVQVVTEHGIIGTGPSRSTYFIPSDRYKKLDQDAVIPRALCKIQETVLDGSFKSGDYSKITMQRAHSLAYNQSPGGRRKCKCIKGCTARCSCVKHKTECTSGCACNGSCKNPHNEG